MKASKETKGATETTTASRDSTSTSNKNNKAKKDELDKLTEMVKTWSPLPGKTDDYQLVADWIQASRNILVLSGAGVSCSAGIPDFRTPGTGLYDNLQLYNLPYAEAVFDVGFYQENPQPFCSLSKQIWPGLRYSPTLTHSFVAMLASKATQNEKKLLRNYTQNIDGLEALAKIPLEQLVECHGHFRTASCVTCGEAFDGDECKSIMLQDENQKQDPPPKCKTCGGYVKPDIVFFGEGLPDRFGRLLQRDLRKADLLIVMGTSLTVAPVSLIPDMVSRQCKRVLINKELVGNFSQSKKNNMKHKRDVFLEGDCDETVQTICQILNWHDELLEWNQSTQIPKQHDDTVDE